MTGAILFFLLWPAAQFQFAGAVAEMVHDNLLAGYVVVRLGLSPAFGSSPVG